MPEQTSVQIDTTTRELLRLLAQKDDRPMSSYLRRLIRREYQIIFDTDPPDTNGQDDQSLSNN